ncbi:hypothetical protein D3C81_2041600 [compost metagenome]
MQNRYLGLHLIRLALVMQLFNLSELIGNLLDVVTEIRIRLNQMQVAPETDPVNWLPEQRAPDVDPVFFGIQGRVPALHKGRRTAKAHREQIRMQPDLMRVHFYP